MGKKIVFKTETGIAIITPTNSGFAIFGIEGIAQKDIPRILPEDKQLLWNEGKMSRGEYLTYLLPEYKIINESEMPAPGDYEYFKGAVQYDMSIDISKAREIKKEKLRIEREPFLNILSSEYLKALGDEDIPAQQNIITQMNVLRNITDLVDGAKTIAEIKDIKITI